MTYTCIQCPVCDYKSSVWCYFRTSYVDSRRFQTMSSLCKTIYLHSSGENAVCLFIVIFWLGTVLYLLHILLARTSQNQKCYDFVRDYISPTLCLTLALFTITHYQIVPISGINVSSHGAKMSCLFKVLVCFKSALLFLYVVIIQYFPCPLCDYQSKPRCSSSASHVDSHLDNIMSLQKNAPCLFIVLVYLGTALCFLYIEIILVNCNVFSFCFYLYRNG